MNEELQIAAAEYVLGTLPADERARFAERLVNDLDLRNAVRWWQQRFSGLDAAIAPEAVSPSVWRAIERAMTQERTAPPGSSAASNVVQLRRRLAAWRGAALAAGAMAAGLAGFVVLDRLAVPPVQDSGRYVAVVDTDGREPALIAEVDTISGTIHVRSLTAQVPAGQSLELWHIAEGADPLSLGVLEVGGDAQTIADRVAAGPVDGVIAVTVEPEGGSPSGDPTGPVVYSGRLISVE